MKPNKKVLIVSLVGITLVMASIPIAFFMISNTKDHEKIHIEFIPKEITSYPNHTAWLLLDINTKSSDLMSNLSLIISTNASIELNYEIWENSPVNKVIEIFLYPNITHLNYNIEIEATVYSSGISKKDYAKIEVVDWTLEISPEIIAMRDEFVNYLSNNHTTFKINESTIWEGLGRAPLILVVEHYLFKSAYWEMELARHATVAPYDWVTIYLRPRSSLYPNWSGSISSWISGNHTVIEVEPPDEIYR
ncbi:MAG: hypothetical protein ACFFA0_03120 [Promethearchaeota archaeon]